MSEKQPVYLQICKKFEDWIREGIYKEGDKLPSETELAHQFNVSRMTIRHSLRILSEQGFIRILDGVGSYVMSAHRIIDTMSFSSFSKKHHKQGAEITNNVLKFKKIQPPQDIAKDLSINPEDPVWYIERLRFLNEKPIMLEHIWMAVGRFPTLTKDVLEGSRYEWISKQVSSPISYAQRTISAVQAGRIKSRYFGLSPHMPMLSLRSVAFFCNTQPFEVVNIFYHPAYYTLSGRLMYKNL